MIYTYSILIAGALYFGWYLATYNVLASFRNAVDQTWSNIEVELNRRFDLIGNLVSVVKGYANYEKETLSEIIAARSGTATKTYSVAEALQLQNELGRAVTKLFALAESYPDLKADQQFLKLQLELTETENRIATRRTAYNATVNLYLNKKMEFPSSIIASAHSFPEKAYFDMPDELPTTAPKVALS